jgi:SAM-dependent methyltransferase
VSLQFWELDHLRRRDDPRLRQPTDLAREALMLLPAGSAVLDLGCGNGHDSVFLADAGLQVTALDFATAALDGFLPAARPVTVLRHSIADTPYPLDEGGFDAVYARLSLHYFDATTTREVLGEIHRLLRPGGLLLVLVNSVDDPEYGQGLRVEESFYELKSGVRKRFFTTEGLRIFTHGLFDQVSVVRDGTFLRFIGKRPA